MNEWTNDAPLNPIALKALMVMPSLLLQKVSKSSKSKDHTDQLKKRLDLWKAGDFDTLVREVRFIQSKLKFPARSDTIEHLAKRFNDLMLSGKINSAPRLLSSTESSGILNVDKETTELLLEKHPVGAEKHCDLLLQGP